VSLLQYMSDSPVMTFFLAFFALIAFGIFMNNAGAALTMLFSRINAGKDEQAEPENGKKS
jgi:hypothetical protein